VKEGRKEGRCLKDGEGRKEGRKAKEGSQEASEEVKTRRQKKRAQRESSEHTHGGEIK
jgi:hypothetical protein